jgi:hypothetical protein
MPFGGTQVNTPEMPDPVSVDLRPCTGLRTCVCRETVVPPLEVLPSDFNYSHQQYLYKNPDGYCGIGPNGMTCQVGVAKTS